MDSRTRAAAFLSAPPSAEIPCLCHTHAVSLKLLETLDLSYPHHTVNPCTCHESSIFRCVRLARCTNPLPGTCAGGLYMHSRSIKDSPVKPNKISAKKQECGRDIAPACPCSPTALGFSDWPLQGKKLAHTWDITGWISHMFHCTPPKSEGISKRRMINNEKSPNKE